MYVAKGGLVQRINESTLPYWLEQGWSLDQDGNGVPDAATVSSTWAADTARIANVHAQTRQTPRGAWVQRLGDAYHLLYWAAPGWVRTKLPLVTGSGTDGPFGAGGAHMIRGVDHVAALAGLTYAAAAPTETGTWTDSTSAPWTWRRTQTPGDSTTWTTPAGSTSVGLVAVRHSSAGGVARVAIDGDYTAAVGLPTAQKLADTGRIDAALLTTGGGTLDPAHRCLLTYAPTTAGDQRILLADGLAPGAHVVRVELTAAYRPGASSADRRVALQGFASATDTPPDPTTTNLHAGVALSDTTSAWEVATQFAPAAGGAATFLGTYHGNQTEAAFTVTVDGAAVALVDAQSVQATQAVVLKATGTLVHPTGGYVADIETTYTLDVAGLRIAPRVTWQAAGSVKTAYAMLPLSGPRLPGGFTHATTSRRAAAAAQIPSTVGLDADYAVSKAPAAWAWSDRWTAVHHVQDHEAWTAGGVDERGTAVEGRSLAVDHSLVKVYNPRTMAPAGESVAIGTVHAYTAQTRFARRGNSDPAGW